MAGNKPLAGVPVLVTAGPTREPLDPVRYLSNRSSGKMGFAVARAAAEAGAVVTLVAGPVGLATPDGIERVDVETASEMHEAVMARVRGGGIFVAAAAVADYRPASRSAHKIKKGPEVLQLALERNPDILAEVAALADPPFTVGFAAETRDVAANARGKLVSKGLDMIAANRVGAGLAFDQDQNALLVIWPEGEVRLPMQDKLSLAKALIAQVARRFHASHENGASS